MLFGKFFQLSADIIFRKRTAGRVISRQTLLFAASTFRNARQKGRIRSGDIELHGNQSKTVRQLFHDSETMSQQPFRIAHERQLLRAYHGYQAAFSLTFCVLHDGLKQGIAMPFTFILPRNPKTIYHYIVRSLHGSPCLFRRYVFDKHLGSFVQSSEHITLAELLFQPFFLRLITLCTLFI